MAKLAKVVEEVTSNLRHRPTERRWPPLVAQAIAVEAGVIDAAAPEANVVARVETTGATIK
jgi:hypothetical protein